MKIINAISPTILSVESSTKACSVSLYYQGKSYTEFKIAPQQHANFMLEMVKTVLENANIKGQDIDSLALCEGPGAFTGVRIATGVIQGLAYGWDKPVLSVSSLEALAWQNYKTFSNTKIIACLDARMKEMYLQECEVIDKKLYSSPPQILSAEKASQVIKASNIKNGVGDIAEDFLEVSQLFEDWQITYPSAEYVAQIASQRQDQVKMLADKIPLPLYLRNNIAVKKLDRK